MFALRIGLLIAVISALSFAQDSTFPAASAKSQGLDPALLEQLSGVVRGFVEDGDIVGAELLVIKNRKTVLHAAFGAKDGESRAEWTPETIVNIRSMSKPLTGTLAQMMIDSGDLSLDAKASTYLPSFAKGKAAAITIEHLITHRSGLPMSCIDRELDTYDSLKEIADQAGGVGPDFEPGSRFRYSDAGSDSLGAVLEVIGEARLDQQIRQRILDPVGMSDSDHQFADDDSRRARLASIHVGMKGAWHRYWSPEDKAFYPFAMGSQSVWSTPQDYARFLALWMDGGKVGDERLLSSEAIARGLEPVSGMNYPTWLRGLQVHYGRMWQLWLDDSKQLVAFGHGGSDGTYAIAFPKRDLIVLYFTQSRGQQTISMFERALDAAVLNPDAKRLEELTQEIPTDTLRPYLGLYRVEGEERYRAVVLEKGKLSVEVPGEQILSLQPGEEPDVWTLEQLAAQKLHFVRDDKGNVTHIDVKGPVAEEQMVRFHPDPEAPSVDALMKRVLDAHGAANFDTLSPFRLTGKLTIQAQKRTGTLDDLYSGRGHRLVTMQFEGLGEQRLGMLGDRAWNQRPGGRPTAMVGVEGEQAILGSFGAMFDDWRTVYREVRVLYQRDFAGEPCWVVRAVPHLGTSTTKYVSVKSGRLLGEERIPYLPGIGALGSTVTFEDYRDVGGLLLPFRTTSKAIHPMIGTIVTQYEKVELEVDIDETAFAMPKSDGD